MSKKDQKKENIEAFMKDLMKVMHKHEDKVAPEDAIFALQSVVFEVVFNVAPSEEEAIDFLYDSIDEFLELRHEEFDSPEDATIAIK